MKRNDKRELKRDKEELSRWKNKITHIIEDFETVVKDRINRLESDKANFEKYRETELERMKKRDQDSRSNYEVSSLKREIERLERTIKEKEEKISNKAKVRENLQVNNQNSL